MRTSLAAGLAVTALVGASLGLVTGAGPASAATRTGCWGASCAGYDPASSAHVLPCNGAVTVTAASLYDGAGRLLATVQNYYSKACNANWARGVLSQFSQDNHYAMQIQDWTDDANGHHESGCYPGVGDTGRLVEDCDNTHTGYWAAYTDMVDGTNRTGARVTVWTAGGTRLGNVDSYQ